MWWKLLWWIIVTALTDLLTKAPPDAVSAGIGDFNIPTATEGRVVPLVVGNLIKINAPNCIWYGDFAAIERTQETGVIIKKESVIGYTYELALAYALASTGAEPLQGITRVWIGDQVVYDGVAATVIDIEEDDIFGGKNQGGGFIGRIRLFNGDPAQGVSAFMDSRLTEPTPAYRGTAYIMVTDIAETKGAEIGESPNLRYITCEVAAMSTVAQGAKGDYIGLGDDTHLIGDDANPASLAYGLLTDQAWGRALPLSSVDAPSFIAAAATCFTEGIGFSMLFDEFTTTEKVQDFLEQHMDAYIGPNAQTGKFEIKLARPDYVLASEFQATDANIIDVPTWNKGDWTQTFNRVRLRYADRQKEWNETHSVANAPANRIIQGVLKSQEVRYPGVHEASIANKIAAREKKHLSRPSRSGTVELNREAWNLRPGDVFSFTSQQVSETDLPVRITKVEIGDPLNNTLVCEVVEDIFDNETPTVADPPDTDFVPPTQDVDPFLVADQWVMEAPYMMCRQDPVSPNVYPRAATGARIATGAPTEYEVINRDPGGSGSYVSVDFVGGGLMQAGVLRDTEIGLASGNGGKTMQIDPIAGSLDNLINPYSPTTGNMQGVAVINPGASNEEWIVFTEAVDDLGGIRLEGLWRGALDSTMHAHTAGERIWFIWTGGFGLPSKQYTPNTTVDFKFLPRSPTDAVLEPAATAMALIPFTTNPRYLLPLLPSKVSLNGIDFASTMDFTQVQTVSGGSDFIGARISPLLKDWRVQDPLDQVGSGFIRSGIHGEDEHEIEYWIYNLETDPSPSRGVAIYNATAAAEFASNGIVDIASSLVEAEFIAAGKNSLDMRIEVETSHIPGFSQPRMLSRDVHLHDFTGTGVFIIPFDAVYLHCDFEHGSAGDRHVRDHSANLHLIEMANTDSGLSTSVSPPLGTRAMRFGETNGVGLTWPNNTSAYLRLPGSGDVSGELDFNQDWTVEWRMRSDADPFADETVISHGGGSSTAEPRWRIVYMEDELYWRFNYALQLGTLNQNINMVEAVGFTPVADTWYAYMLTRQLQTDGSITLRLFRDGIRVSQQNVAAFTINSAAPNPDVTIGAGDVNRTVTSGATGDGMQGYLDSIRIIAGAALELIDYTVPVVEAEYASKEYLIAQTSFKGEAGRDADKHDEDFASTDMLWVYDGTQAQCRIAGDKAKFGNTSLFVDGTQDAGLRWGNFETYDQQKHQHLLNHDFTIEGWVNYTALPSTTSDGMALCGRGDNGGNEREYFFGVDENDEVEFSYWDHNIEATEVNIKATTTPVLVVDTWYHLVVCRNGVAIEAWIDGTRVLNDATFFEDAGTNPVTFNAGENNSGGAICVGKAFRDESGGLHRSMNGHIDSIRITKREARYTGATITVPTAAIPTPEIQPAGRPVFVADQAALHYHNHFNMEDATYDPWWNDVITMLHFEGTDTDTTTTDDGSHGPTWTFNNNAQIDSAQAAFGSTSCVFDGIADSITAPDDNIWHELGAGNFCIEAQVRWATDPTGTQQCIVGKWGTSPGFCWKLWHDSDDHLAFNYSTNGSSNTHVSAAFNFAVDTWYHVAIVSDQTDIGLYVDGVQIGSFTNNITALDNHTSLVSIGATTEVGSEDYFDGWIDEVRITKGRARYTPQSFAPDYTPQQAAWSHKEGYEFPTDLSNNSFVFASPVGNPLIDTSQKKFGTASLYLDGSSQIEINDNAPAFSANNFLIECQVRFDGDPATGNATFLANWDTTGSDESWILALRNNELVFEWNDGSSNFTTAGAWNPADATWYHLTVSKVQGMIRLFVDGTLVNTPYECDSLDRAIDDGTEPMTIGTHMIAGVATDRFTGWIDEVRIVTHIQSMWPNHNFPVANFTAPTTEYDHHRVISMPGVDRDVAHLGYPLDVSLLGHTITPNQKYNTNDGQTAYKFAKAVSDERGAGYHTMFDDGGGTPYFRMDYQAELQLRTHDFTIEGWFLHDTDPKGTQQTYASHAELNDQESWVWRYNSTDDAIEFQWTTTGSSATRARIYADWSGVAINTWYHLAVTREGDTIRFFIDGVLQTNNVGSATFPTNHSFFETTHSPGWFIWDADFSLDNPTQPLRGAGFDQRWTKGKALYTATFTPPSQVLPRFGQCVPDDGF